MYKIETFSGSNGVLICNEDINIPSVVKIPPRNVVVRNPNLSTRIPETGEKKKVAPIVNDPTSAINKEEINLIE